MGLSKRFDGATRATVDQLSLDLGEGHVTALLGHNGAGKTTTINMLIGLCPPTAGTALVYGKDVRREWEEVRAELGFCPQKNILFDRLTVSEHAQFFAELRGSWGRDGVQGHVDDLLKRTGLVEHRDRLAGELSPGLKRRLCVALAFLGPGRAVILDEPTAGVDPAARQQVWDVIAQNKAGKTVLICTHHLDEADVLSDRVAVLHRGRLLTTATPFEMKRQYGTGYRLTLTSSDPDSVHATSPPAAQSDSLETFLSEGTPARGRGPPGSPEAPLLGFVRRFVPGAEVIGRLGSEVSISLPQSPHQSPGNLIHLLEGLEESKEALHLSAFNLSESSLEDAFVSICRGADRDRSLGPELGPGSRTRLGLPGVEGPGLRPFDNRCPADGATSKPKEGINPYPRKSFVGSRLRRQQAGALLYQRFLHYRRDWRTLICIVGLPCLFLLMAMAFGNIRSHSIPQPAVELKPSLYGPESYVFWEGERFDESLVDVKGPTGGPSLGGSRLVPNGTSWAREAPTPSVSCFCPLTRGRCLREGSEGDPSVPVPVGRRRWQKPPPATAAKAVPAGAGPAGELGEAEEDVQAWFRPDAEHALPVAVNVAGRAKLRFLLGLNLSIAVHSHPLHQSSGGREAAATADLADAGISLVFLCAFTTLAAGLVPFVVRERLGRGRQLQTLAGVPPGLYWTVNFCWDMASYTVITLVAAVLMLIFQQPVFTARLNLPATLLLIWLYG